MNLSFIDPKAFTPARNANALLTDRLSALATMNRLNALTAIKRAGSGHIGSSFSSIDIFTLLYEQRLKEGDVFFSSKGHDAPGQYACMAAVGILSIENVLDLRRLGGLPGHPEVGTPGVVASTGSLGMGLSKARGIALARNLRAHDGRVFVMLGDGELQEGQNYEALRSIANDGLSQVKVVVDYNKIQSDKYVRCINDLGDIEAKLSAFGWTVRRADGHDFDALTAGFEAMEADHSGPQILIADTVKGRGVSFMEAAPDDGDPTMVYAWHSGAPKDEDYERAIDELVQRVRTEHEGLSVEPPELSSAAPGKPSKLTPSADGKGAPPLTIAKAIGEELVALAETRSELLVLDADLADDCGLRDFENLQPRRFFESGIAEQDMVSTAGALAGQGFTPVCGSFASFLCARANEQIYNNTCEGRKVIYIGQYAGVLPAAAGYSHQSIRDIALMAQLDKTVVVQPGSAAEARALIRWAVESSEESVYIRSLIVPPPTDLETSPSGLSPVGCGVQLADGNDLTILSYGPVLLNEALKARAALSQHGVSARVVSMPWLNRIDADWLFDAIGEGPVFVLEDHSPIGGLGDRVAQTLASAPERAAGNALHVLGIEGLPACGQPHEVLQFHGVDAESVCERVLSTRGS
ncbi:MAG: transketolase C-terminal domain-containing protein [Pseudomonadota bacterium]